MTSHRLLFSASVLLLLQACGGGENAPSAVGVGSVADAVGAVDTSCIQPCAAPVASEPDTELSALQKSELPGAGATASLTAPVNLWVSPRQGHLVVEWAKVAGATGYHVYRSLMPGGQGAALYRSNMDAGVLFDTNVKAGSTYYYQVAGVNAAGVGPRTNVAGGSPTPAQTTPTVPPTASAPTTAPVNLWVTQGPGQLVVEWAKVAGATGYNVYRSLTADGRGATLHRNNLDAGVLFDTGLAVGSMYYYQVAAVNAGGLGPRTAVVGGSLRGPRVDDPVIVGSLPPTGLPTGPNPVSAASVGNLTDLVLVNFTGDCNGVRARVFNRSTQRFFGFNDPAPCGNPAYAAPKNLYSGLLQRAVSGQVTVVELLQTAAGQRLSASERVGDCRVQHLQVKDEYVGTPLSYVTPKSCSEVGMTEDAHLPTRMISHYIRTGVEPIVAAAPYSPALTRCDKTANPATLAATLAAVTNGADGQVNSQWQVVCLTPGTYAGPYTLRGANHVMLVAKQPGTVKLRTHQPIANGVVGAPLSVWYSSNIVLQNIDFENAHQFAYNPPGTHPSINLQYSVGLYMGYVNGSLVEGGKVTSGGKTGMWLQDDTHMRVRNMALHGAYFALTTEKTNLLGENMTITTRHPTEQADEHTTTWLDDSGIVFKDTRLLPQTGRGFAAGRANPALNATFMKNVISEPGLDSWLQQNRHYFGLHLILQGTYPSSTVDYFYNMYDGGGTSPTMAVFKQ